MIKQIITLFLLILSIASAHAGLNARWSSSGVLPGETNLVVVISPPGIELNYVDKYIRGAGVKLVEQAYTQISSQQDPLQINILQIVIDSPGTFVLPTLDFQSDTGVLYHTDPHEFTVYNFQDVQWVEVPNSQGAAHVGTLWHSQSRPPYVSETIPCELKIYVNRGIVGFGNIPFITPSGATSSRFMPTYSKGNRLMPAGSVLIRGEEWAHLTFSGTITPIQAGDITLKASIEGLAQEQMGNSTFFSQRTVKIPIQLPDLKLKAQSLPGGAPSNFSHAVGQFSISATTDAMDLSLNEPINVKVTVSGSGFPPNMEIPKLKFADNWKLYPASRIESEDGSGIEFTQMIRPTAETREVPPFELCYFDPTDKQYKTVTTKGIPLEWKSTGVIMPADQNTSNNLAQAPPAGIMPVEKMTDIYGFIPRDFASIFSASGLLSCLRSPWIMLIYVLPACLLTLILVNIVRQLRLKNAATRLIMRELKEAGKHTAQTDFLRAIGNVISTHIPDEKMTEELHSILITRDSVAFNPEHDAKTPMNPKEKKSMMQTVRKTIGTLTLLLIALMFQAQGSDAEGFYRAKEYTQALTVLDALPEKDADTLYLMGNCHYKLNRPGIAALYYRKALELSPGCTEAEKNLEFIERKEGALYPRETTFFLDYLHYIPYNMLPGIIHIGLALALAAIFLMILKRKKPVLLSITATLFLTVAILAYLNYHNYPRLPETIAPDRLLVVTSPAEAMPYVDGEAKPMMKLPPSTPLILRAKRGMWTYADTFTGTPVWIKSEHIRCVGKE